MSEHDILYDIGVAVRFLADINGSEWIKGNDAGAVDMRQRAVAAHAAAYRALNAAEELEKQVQTLRAALLPFARYERVRIDPVVKTRGKSLVAQRGSIWVTSAMVDDKYTEAEITVEDMTMARKLTGV